MRHLLIIAALVALVIPITSGFADVPELMSYQGLLRDGIGDPVPDGVYSLTFRLYEVETGGTAIWTETQNVSVADAVFSATLGQVTPLGTLEFDVPYWLGISVGADPELAPRVELTSAPYAFRAAVAESLAGGGTDSDWQYNGDDIYRLTGRVAIGTDSPFGRLTVAAEGDEHAATISGNGTGPWFSVNVVNPSGTAGAFSSSSPPSGYPATPAAVFAAGGSTANAGHFVAYGDGSGVLAYSLGAGAAVEGHASGAGYAGFFDGGSGVRMDCLAWMDGFQMDTGASPGHVLTSDASGVGTWQAPAAVPDGDWTIAAPDMYSAVSGDVGIGTSAPTAKLEVSSSASDEVLQVTHGGTYSRVCNVERTTAPSSANDILQIKVPTGSVDDFQFIECERDGVEFAVDGDGHVYSGAGADLNGELTVANNGTRVATFTTDYAAADVHVVHAEYTGTDAASHSAVYGDCRPADEYGFGGLFYGGYAGVRAVADLAGTGYRYGVSASALNGAYNYAVKGVASNGTSNYGLLGESLGTGTCRGVRAYAHGTGTNYAVSAYAHGGTINWAGYFSGDVNINGTLSKTAGTFRIDHPLDPEGKYLQHSFVESPDMMNVYNGNVVLDGNGEAWVELPEWFEVLNRDFRYQLTCIGGFAPVYVAEKIRGNRFRIAGGESGMEISWQVTGVRQDRYAEEHRVQVEVEKPPSEVGKYIHPELYGRPTEDAIGYEEPPEPIREPAASGAVAVPRERPSAEDE